MSEKALEEAGFLDGLDSEEARLLTAIAEQRQLAAGEYLFRLGDDAEKLYVVARGTIDLCFPMTVGKAVKDVAIESMTPGRALGWSSLVEPYRFTFSARSCEPTTVWALARSELSALFEVRPRLGYLFTQRLTQTIGLRLLSLQALWTRELQRSLEHSLESSRAPDEGREHVAEQG